MDFKIHIPNKYTVYGKGLWHDVPLRMFEEISLNKLFEMFGIKNVSELFNAHSRIITSRTYRVYMFKEQRPEISIESFLIIVEDILTKDRNVTLVTRGV